VKTVSLRPVEGVQLWGRKDDFGPQDKGCPLSRRPPGSKGGYSCRASTRGSLELGWRRVSELGAPTLL